jgi:group II intron reverse transcriptase/maturase
VSQALDRVRRTARQKKKEKFTALFHHVTIDLLRLAFFALKRDAAPGVDGLTWRDYEADLEIRLVDLHDRVHWGAYRALPSRRRHIPKPDGRQRPLAVAALEDKIVQRAVLAVLNAIYEEDFLGFSYGFRPNRSQHDALDALVVGIDGTKANWIVDADIRSFFDEVSQDWLIRFVEHRIGDKRIVRLIHKGLKAGVLEDGVVIVGDQGTGQGSVISPLLANIYLHYVFDLWALRWRRREAAGDMIIVRYADDIILGFEHEVDARRFLDAMRERLEEFSLSLHPEKTRLIEFGRFAAENRKRRGFGKPETFDFLGFTFVCGEPTGQVPRQKQVPARPHAGEAQGDQGGTATADAPDNPSTGKMAGACHHRLLQLSRRADQQSRTRGIPGRDHPSLAVASQPPQPEECSHLGPDEGAGGRLAPTTAYPSPLAQSALRRQTPEVGAVCGKAARTDLCGGHGVTRVPTATEA